MKKKLILISTVILFFLIGCDSSIILLNDPNFFSEKPMIVTKENRYFIRFRYPESSDFCNTFFRMTSSKIYDDKVVFYTPCTASSGNLRGVIQFEEIVNKKKLSLLKNNSAFWLEPDKTLIPLKIETMKEDLAIISSHARKNITHISGDDKQIDIENIDFLKLKKKN